MSEPLRIVIPGEPVPWARARSCGKRRFTAPEQARWMEHAKWQARLQARLPTPIDGPVSVALTATFTPPASWSRKRQDAAIRGDIPHTVKPDGSNLLKILEDALNGIVWTDDARINRASFVKCYGAEAGVTVEVEA